MDQFIHEIVPVVHAIEGRVGGAELEIVIGYYSSHCGIDGCSSKDVVAVELFG